MNEGCFMLGKYGDAMNTLCNIIHITGDDADGHGMAFQTIALH